MKHDLLFERRGHWTGQRQKVNEDFQALLFFIFVFSSVSAFFLGVF